MPPWYLQNIEMTENHHRFFDDDEWLYRRSPQPEPDDHFETMATDKLTVEGLSVNRSRLSPLPQDVLWAPRTYPPGRDANGNFEYEYKGEYHVLTAQAGSFKNLNEHGGPFALKFKLLYKPEASNRAHSLILVTNLNIPAESSKKDKQKARGRVRLYVASFFQRLDAAASV